MLLASTTILFAQNRPFPQAGKFETGGAVIKPSDRKQEQLNQDVIHKFDNYKKNYLMSAADGKFYISAKGAGDGGDECVTQSEAHGYGMLIFALMAGYDVDAKKIFDGMNALRKSQHSNINPDLMSWIVNDADVKDTTFESSATDGDLDMAYALLLAYKQWGDEAYLNDAKKLISAIKKSTMGAKSHRTLLGDWAENELDTRSSDWMAGHFRAFNKATGDKFWLEAADTVYALLKQSANKETGLMADFVTGSPAHPDATGGGTTGEHHQDDYSYNACRTPWRIALDYAHHGTPAAKAQIDKISAWLNAATGGKPKKIVAGYKLDGEVINYGDGDTWNDVVFTAPFASAMIANPANQNFLNATYYNVRNMSTKGAYGAALQLLNMLFVTGNWWSPYGVEE